MYVVVLAGLILGAFSQGREAGPSGAMAVALGTAAMAFAPPAAASILMLYIGTRRRKVTLDAAAARQAAWQFYSRAAQCINVLSVLAYAASLHVFGWCTVPRRAGVSDWDLPTGALVAFPFILSLVLTWIPLHYAESQFRSHGPTLRQQLSFNVRQYILTLVVPMAIVLAATDATGLLPRGSGGVFQSSGFQAALGAAAILGGYTLAPLVLVRLWKTTRMPECPLRRRLSEICKAAGVAFRDIRIWETPGLFFLNAAVMGITARVRYVVISRVILEVMPQAQVEAVFAHELAHARKHHIGYYLLFAGDFLLLATLVGGSTGLRDIWAHPAYAVLSVVAFAAYWGIGFGYLSRMFEREADLVGAQTIGNPDLFNAALAGIAQLSGMNPAARSWRHGSIISRIRFVRAAAADGAVRESFTAGAAFVRILLATTALSAAAAHMVMEALLG